MAEDGKKRNEETRSGTDAEATGKSAMGNGDQPTHVTVPPSTPEPESSAEPAMGTLKKKRKPIVIAGSAIAIVLIIVIALFALHVVCFHDWAEATCTEPRTCKTCSRTEGEPLAHQVVPATCTKEPYCSVCGARLGGKLGHKHGEWIIDAEATCTAEGSKHTTCTRCGENIVATVEKLPHTEGEWAIEKDYSISSSGTVVPGERALKCAVCGETMKTEEYAIELTMGQKNAIAKANDYLDFTAFSYTGLIGQLEYEGFSTEDATFAADHCGADWNEQAAEKAQDYLDFTSFSRDGLIDQLEYEGFTREQAEYGVTAVGY